MWAAGDPLSNNKEMQTLLHGTVTLNCDVGYSDTLAPFMPCRVSEQQNVSHVCSGSTRFSEANNS